MNKVIGPFWSNVTAGMLADDLVGIYCMMGSNVPGNPAGSILMATGSKPPLNNWHYITCVADGTNLRIFVNGNQVNSVAISALTHSRSENTAPLILGRFSVSFNGLIDDVRIYSAAMPLAYIQEQYLQGLQSLLANNGITEQEYNQRMAEFNQNLVLK